MGYGGGYGSMGTWVMGMGFGDGGVWVWWVKSCGLMGRGMGDGESVEV